MKEFVDFLEEQSPYDVLDRVDLERLAAQIEVEYFRAGTRIVTQGSAPLTHMWVVRTGTVEVLDDDRVLDLLSSGDTFGHVSLLSGLSPPLTVRAAQDTVCYRLPDPRPLLERPEQLRFEHYGAYVAKALSKEDARALRERAHAPVSRFARAIVTCPPHATVREAAVLVGQAQQSCVVVAFDDGIGIVTDSDFRARVATGDVPLDAPVSKITTRPVLTVPEDTDLATAFLEMLERGVHHLVLTDGGDRPVGMVRVADLASAEVRDPLIIRSAVMAATSLDDLRDAVGLIPTTALELYDTGVPAVRVGHLLSAVLDATLRRVLTLETHMAQAGSVCSWMVLGSLARREVLPTSDVDTAIVWADPTDGRDVAPSVRLAASRVLDDMEKVGLKRCADGANADTPRFSRSLSQWSKATVTWLRDAGQEGALLLSTMLADSRPITELALGRSVTDRMLATPRSPQFLHSLLDYTLSARPPTGFVRDFVVEHSGEHRGKLNLKRGGLRPLTSLGRWAAIVTGDTSGTTPERLRRAGEAGLLTRDESESLIGAFEQVYDLLLQQEIEAVRAGGPASTYINPAGLDTLTRRHLRESFRAIAQVQGRLDSQWRGRIPGTS